MNLQGIVIFAYLINRYSMKVDYIALSIPIFFILIGIELLYATIKKVSIYRLNDSLTNISLGIGQQITGIFMKTAIFFGYLFLYENYRLFTIQNAFLVWVMLFIGVDFFYYWFHRLSHQVNVLWAAHIVHHQSEEYNLSVALRQSWLQNAFSWAFYLPLAFAGFDPVMFLTVSSFNTLYQFWIHTRTIGKMGPLEWILNTPSHHRVHHGSDPRYIDKNHGGTLIIWDRLFGTFCEEEKEPHYGITTPLKSWNPVWANIHYWADLFRISSKSANIKDKILIFLKPPGWMPESQGGFQPPKEIDGNSYSKFDTRPDKAVNIYIFFQFTAILLLSTFVLFKQTEFSFLQLAALSTYILLALALFGALFERKKWGVGVEFIRLITTPILVFLFKATDQFTIILVSVTGYALISALIFCLLTIVPIIQFSNQKS